MAHRTGRHHLLFLFSVLLFAYALSCVFTGNRSYFAWQQVNAEHAALQQQLNVLQTRQTAMENQVALLRPDSLNLDMLDEQARAMLNYVEPDEVVLVVNAPQIAAIPVDVLARQQAQAMVNY